VSDAALEQFREKISDTDRAILDAVNTRIELVAQIKTYKDAHGIAFLDPEREATMLESLTNANRGPLSSEGLRELFTTILDLTKREVQDGSASA
jgi:chorismate mutase